MSKGFVPREMPPKDICDWRAVAADIAKRTPAKDFKGMFIAEYADAHYYREEVWRLNSKVRSLAAKLGRMKRAGGSK